ncbi:DUF3017 domain-containing protein [Janibacter sp. GS2]|uniref:DUF3017 domain-containing protein n=1 Tax=Janibacter sp. GS2 TaxID=3442646 RepID=UPI003EBB1FB9
MSDVAGDARDPGGQGADEEDPGPTRPALQVRPLAAWWLIAAGIVVGMLFLLTDHVLRATVTCAATLLLAAVLRLALPGSKAGGIAVRGPLVDTVTLVVLALAVLASGFSLDLTAR